MFASLERVKSGRALPWKMGRPTSVRSRTHSMVFCSRGMQLDQCGYSGQYGAKICDIFTDRAKGQPRGHT
jgi:hypothetical protein